MIYKTIEAHIGEWNSTHDIISDPNTIDYFPNIPKREIWDLQLKYFFLKFNICLMKLMYVWTLLRR